MRVMAVMAVLDFNVPVTQPYSVPYTLGAGGTGSNRNTGQNSNAGTASSFNTNLVANGGNGGLAHPSTILETMARFQMKLMLILMAILIQRHHLYYLHLKELLMVVILIKQQPSIWCPGNSLNTSDIRFSSGGIGGTRGGGNQAPVVQNGRRSN